MVRSQLVCRFLRSDVGQVKNTEVPLEPRLREEPKPQLHPKIADVAGYGMRGLDYVPYCLNRGPGYGPLGRLNVSIIICLRAHAI